MIHRFMPVLSGLTAGTVTRRLQKAMRIILEILGLRRPLFHSGDTNPLETSR